MRIFLLLFLFLASPLASQTYPPYQVGPVVDTADLLPEAEEVALSDKLKELRRETKAEFFVLTLPSQADFAPGLSLPDFAGGTFKAWRLGDPLKMDGVLVVLLLDTASAHIALGEGFSDDLAAKAQRIVDETLIPALQSGEPAPGIIGGVTATIDEVVTPFLEAPEPEPASSGGGLRISFNPAYLIIGALALYAVIAGRRHLSSLMARYRRCPECGDRAIRETSKTDFAPTRHVAGRGTTRRWCESCDYLEESVFVIPKTGRTDQSSFGGGT